MSASLEYKGFFAALFDFSFTSFLTLKFLKVIYALLVAFTLLFGLLFLIFGLSRGGAGAVLSLFLVPLVTFLCLLLARVLTEGLALFFRIGENTSIIAGALSAGVAPTVGPTTYAGSTVVTPDPAPPPSRKPLPCAASHPTALCSIVLRTDRFAACVGSPPSRCRADGAHRLRQGVPRCGPRQGRSPRRAGRMRRAVVVGVRALGQPLQERHRHAADREAPRPIVAAPRLPVKTSAAS